jgi:integrase
MHGSLVGKKEQGSSMRKARRRGNREGTVYRRDSDKRYVATFYADGELKEVYGKTQGEALEKRRLAQQDADAGRLIPKNTQKLADYLDYWLSVHTLTVKPLTRVQYASEIRAHIAPALGHMPLQKLETRHIQQLVSDMCVAGSAPGTVKGVYKILNTAFKDAVAWKLLKANPCQGVKLPREKQDEVAALDEEQTQALLDAVKGTKLAGLVPVALATGLRRGELLALRWSDIDFERGQLHVRHTVIYVNGVGFQETEPKTKSSRRTVKLAGFALDALHEHRKAQLAQRLEQQVQAGDKWQDKDLVFCGKNGGYMAFSTLNYRFKKLLAHIEESDGVHFHSLRHSCATLLIRLGAHPKLVQEVLGHSSIKTTMDKYGHVLPGMQDDAMSALDRRLFEKRRCAAL